MFVSVPHPDQTFNFSRQNKLHEKYMIISLTAKSVHQDILNAIKANTV